jgi:Pao retrotransposon peptidase
LAIRVLQQLAEDERDRFPLADQVTKTDFYVDDCLSGADTLSDALELQSQLVQLMSCGQLLLHKWCANAPELFEAIPVQNREPKLSWSSADKVKALGITWQPVQDTFLVRINELPSQASPITKRIVSSEIARLYDPLGLMGPIIVTAKCQLQRLWQLKTNWDEP